MLKWVRNSKSKAKDSALLSNPLTPGHWPAWTPNSGRRGSCEGSPSSAPTRQQKLVWGLPVDSFVDFQALFRHYNMVLCESSNALIPRNFDPV